jgi:hypothetical protein
MPFALFAIETEEIFDIANVKSIDAFTGARSLTESKLKSSRISSSSSSILPFQHLPSRKERIYKGVKRNLTYLI